MKKAVQGHRYSDRDKIIALGAAAYRMGIERINNPRQTYGEQQLWNAGWDAARAKDQKSSWRAE